MTQFIYTHHQGGLGKMVEKATMRPPTDDEYSFARPYSEAYRLHINSLLTYDASGFSPSDNGKTFGEKDFELVYQVLYEVGVWSDTDKDWYDRAKEDYRRIIAVPLSEKREEDSSRYIPTTESDPDITITALRNKLREAHNEIGKLKNEKREERTQDELWDSFGKIMDDIFCDGGFAYARTRIESIITTLKREGYLISKSK